MTREELREFVEKQRNMNNMSYHVYSTLIDEIDDLEQEPRWIPVSERLPKKGGEYLLWGKILEDDDDNYCFIGDYYEFEEVFGTEIRDYDPKTLSLIDTEIVEYYSVVAWMPKPKPYKAESEVEE